ncbi:type II toxin-antitoxin system HicB family antitoxin [Rhodovibrio salinarum]|uniref:HicB family protein n=1 Tax=Rhodovibrio salinarum TaxID=1087 RepID=A0A934QGT5_9PROT|nr:type II toxin-antitoxin system HicB family antitoxin [Rhodovibrio salinarum]MBK1696392.1 HicB family protein [Rhodovibrio salinarum]
MTYYVAALHKDEDSDYGISFPDFPGCVSAGATVDEAVEMGQEALALFCTEMLEAGTMPEPTPPEQVAQDPDFADATLILVKGPTRPLHVKRVNVTLPEDLLGRIDDRAQREGYTRSGWLAHVTRRALSGDRVG